MRRRIILSLENRTGQAGGSYEVGHHRLGAPPGRQRILGSQFRKAKTKKRGDQKSDNVAEGGTSDENALRKK